MARWARTGSWLCAALLAWSVGAVAADEPRDEATERPTRDGTSDTGSDVASETRTVYVPPSRGSPRTRTSGGTRGMGAHLVLHVLAPDHVGLTTRASPTLAWFVSGAALAPVSLTLLRAGEIEPDLEVTFPHDAETGIDQASLARFGVTLETGVVYEWSVSLAADPERRDRGLVASGAIERVPVAAASGAGDDPRALARAGIWYDALAELARAIEAGDVASRGARADLLDAVGLAEAARWDRAQR